MEAQLTPALSYPAQAYAQSFFEEIPVDSRFISTSYMKFPPSGTIDAKKIEFTLARFEASNLYLIYDTCIEVNCVILKEDGKVPDKEKFVSFVNNSLHRHANYF